MDLGYMKPNKLIYHPDRVKQYLETGDPDPISVKLYLTERCNLACDYCVYKDRITGRDMSQDDFEFIMGSLAMMGVRALVLTGGEPTMHPYFHEMVQYAYNRYGFDIGLITNGVEFQHIKYLTWIRFSVDAIHDYSYKKIKGKNYLQKVLDNVDLAIEEKKILGLDTTIGVQMVVTPENYLQISDFIGYFDETGVDYIQIRPLENARYKDDEMERIMHALIAEKTRDRKSSVILTEYKWDELANNYQKSYPGCPGAKFIGAVGVNGDMHICCTWMKHGSAYYGNLIKDRPPEILKNRSVVLKQFDYSKCPVGCQASLINKFLVEIRKIKHRNFI